MGKLAMLPCQSIVYPRIPVSVSEFLSLFISVSVSFRWQSEMEIAQMAKAEVIVAVIFTLPFLTTTALPKSLCSMSLKILKDSQS